MKRKIQLIVAGALLVSMTGHAAVLLSEDFETGQVVGEQPTGAASVRPSSNSGAIFTKIVNGAENTAGTGNAVQMQDNDAADVANLEYNFVVSAGSQLSAIQVDFSFSAVETGGAGDDYIAVAFGEYSAVRTLGSSGSRFTDMRLYNDGTVDFRGDSGNNTGNDVSTGSHTISLFVNDNLAALNYIGLDSGTYILAANSIAYWLDGTLLLNTALDLDDATAGGTVGTSTNNLGKFGFNTGTSDVGLGYVIDDIVISTIGEVAPTATLLMADFEVGQTVGEKPTGATVVRPSTNQGDVFCMVVAGSANTAGTGNAAQLYDYNTSEGAMLTYNFVGSAGTQISAVQIDFSFAMVTTNGVGDDYYSIAVGEYSSSKTLNASARRFTDARLYNDGTLDFRTSLGTNAPSSTGHDVSSGSHALSIFVNDHDSQAIFYAGIDSGTYTLPANSVAYWLDGSLVLMDGGEEYTTLDLDDPTVGSGGTVGTTTNNLGKFGFNSGSTDVGIDYVIDDIKISLIPQPTADYAGWLELYPTLGTSTNFTDDPDLDNMDNLVEYALGADPTVDDADTFMPTYSRADVDGANWLNYVYTRRLDAAVRGLTYSVVAGTDLVIDDVTNPTEESGSSVIDAGFESVTNRIPTAAEVQAFMKLEVGISE